MAFSFPRSVHSRLRGANLVVIALVATASLHASSWRPFAADSPWNQPIGANAATDPNSKALIDDFASRGPLRVNVEDWSIPVYFVDAAKTPKHAVYDLRPGVFGKGFEFPRAIPIPDGAIASPPVGEHSDNHLCIVDRTLNVEWGMWAARRNERGEWGTGLGAVTDLSGTGVAPPWFAAAREFDAHRARAGGFPLIAGLILVEEFKAGRINHALVFAYDHCRGGFFVPPASTAQVTMQDMSNRTGIPMGGRIQLDPTWDVKHSALSPSGKIIARALQEYGAFCGDFAGANVIYAENSPAALAEWEDVLGVEELFNVFTGEFIRDHFRVIDMGNVLPGQNCEVPPPYITAFRFANATGRAIGRIDYFTRTIDVEVPSSVDRSALIPEFDVFPATARVIDVATPELTQLQARDFSRPVAYKLESQQGEWSEWTVVTSVLQPR